MQNISLGPLSNGITLTKHAPPQVIWILGMCTCENRERDNDQNDDIRTKEKEYFWISGLELQVRLGPEIFKFEIMTKTWSQELFIQC